MSGGLTSERRLRRFLLALAIVVAVGSVGELLLIGHTGDIVQWIPFGLAAIVVGAAGWLRWRPRRHPGLARAALVVVVLGSAFGVYEHVEHNYEFEREIRPNGTRMAALGEALSGASPLMAPGILALAAVIALAGSWRE